MAEVLDLKMDGTGQTFVDSSPSGHTITAGGDAYQRKTALSNKRSVLFFDGDSDYITIPDSADFDLVGDNTQDYTIDFWMYATALGFMRIIGQGTASNNQWVIEGEDNLGLRINIEGNAVAVGDYTDAFNTEEWIHVCLVKKCTAGPTVEWAVYMNGEQQSYMSDDSEGTWAAPLVIGQRPSIGGEYFGGYLKNVRISTSNVFGASPNVGKTDTITVPTADPVSDSDTKLLLLANSPTNYNNPLTSGAHFEGSLTTDYLSAADHADWDITTNWTFDCWIRLDSNNQDRPVICQEEDASNYWRVRVDADGGNGSLRFSVMSGGGYVVNFEAAACCPTLGRWYHIAVCKVGDEYGIYVDGIQKAYLSDSSTDTFAGTLKVGAWYNTWFDGDMKNVRISVNNVFSAAPVAGLTDTIDVPISTPVADSNTKLLLLLEGVPNDTDNTNGWLDDDGNTGHTITQHGSAFCNFLEGYYNRSVVDSGNTGHKGVMVGTAKLMWMTVGGNGAGEFDASGDYLSAPGSTDWNITTNWVADVWVYASTINTDRTLFAHYEDSSNYWRIRIDADSGSGSVRFSVYSGASFIVNFEVAAILTTYEWYHIAICKVGNEYGIYINGRQVAYLSDSDSDTFAGLLYIGGLNASTQLFDGIMDEARINTSNLFSVTPVVGLTDGFTPPDYLLGGGKLFQSIIF